MKEKEQRRIFDDWISDYKALFFKIIRVYATQNEDQNDLFQDISLQVWNSIPNFKRESAVSTWLYRIALNTAIKWSTKEKKHVQNHQQIEGMAHVLKMQEDSDDERLKWLYSEIQNFNEIDRSLTLLLLDGYSYKEMANVLGISESNVGVKIHRVKEQLVKNSKKLENYGV